MKSRAFFFAALLVASSVAYAAEPKARLRSRFPTCDAGRDGQLLQMLDPIDATDCATGTGTATGAVPHSCTCDGESGSWVTDPAGAGGTDDQVASEVPFTPAGGVAATDVQAAIEEVDAEHTSSLPFSAITTDTNTTATMTVGTGAAITVSGTGTNTANRTTCTGTERLLFDGTCDPAGAGSSLFTDGGGDTYLSSFTDDLCVGDSTCLGNIGIKKSTADASFSVQSSATGGVNTASYFLHNEGSYVGGFWWAESTPSITIDDSSARSRIEFLSGETVVNQDSHNLDWRMETDGNDYGFFLDAGLGRFGNTSSLDEELHIQGSQSTRIQVEDTGTGGNNVPGFQIRNEGVLKTYWYFDEAANTTKIADENVDARLVLDSSGNPADSGMLRLSAAECVSWESSPAGADNCLTSDASELLSFKGTVLPQSATSPVTLSAGGAIGLSLGTGYIDDDDLAASAVDGGAGGEIQDDTLTVDDVNNTFTLAGDPGWQAREWWFGANGLMTEGHAADAFEGLLQTGTLTADRTWTLPDAAGTFAVSATAPITLSAAGAIGCTSASASVSGCVNTGPQSFAGAKTHTSALEVNVAGTAQFLIDAAAASVGAIYLQEANVTQWNFGRLSTDEFFLYNYVGAGYTFQVSPAGVATWNSDSLPAFDFLINGDTKTLVSADASTDTLTVDNLVAGSPSGGNMGAGTINATAVYDDGVLLGTSASPAKEFQFPASSLSGGMDPGDSWPAFSHDSGTNIDINTLSFDAATDECAGATLVVPSDVDTGGTITFRAVWYSGTATSGNIIWDVRHSTGQAEGVSWDTALTTETAAADATQGTVDQLTVTTWTETVSTAAWAASDLVSFLVCRDANNASDTLAGDAQLLHFAIEVPRA